MKGYLLAARTLAKLKKFHRKEKRQWAADRIKAVVLLGSGWTLEKTSEALLLDTETLRTYAKKYANDGLVELLHRNYAGGKSRLSHEDKPLRGDPHKVKIIHAKPQNAIQLSAGLVVVPAWPPRWYIKLG